MTTPEIKCPKCGSTQLTANKKGFSGAQAVGGAILTGGIGLLAGTIGSNKIKITCLNCGHQFMPGEDLRSVRKKRRQQAETMKKPGFWIFCICIIILFILFVRSCF
jgi:DNA-directed RNA polymerase subunit RPC12/RpoP